MILWWRCELDKVRNLSQLEGWNAGMLEKWVLAFGSERSNNCETGIALLFNYLKAEQDAFKIGKVLIVVMPRGCIIAQIKK